MQLSSNNETPQRRHRPPATAANLFSNCALAAARGLATHLSQAVSLSSPSLANLWNLLRSHVCIYLFVSVRSFCHHSVLRADTVSFKLGLSSTHVHGKSGSTTVRRAICKSDLQRVAFHCTSSCTFLSSHPSSSYLPPRLP